MTLPCGHGNHFDAVHVMPHDKMSVLRRVNLLRVFDTATLNKHSSSVMPVKNADNVSTCNSAGSLLFCQEEPISGVASKSLTLSIVKSNRGFKAESTKIDPKSQHRINSICDRKYRTAANAAAALQLYMCHFNFGDRVALSARYSERLQCQRTSDDLRPADQLKKGSVVTFFAEVQYSA